MPPSLSGWGVGHPEPRAFPHCTSPASPAPSRRPGACPHPVPLRGRHTRMWQLPGGRVQASGGQAPEQSAPGVRRRGPRGWGTSRWPRPHCPPGGLGDPCRAPLFILAPVPFLTAASPEPRNCHELVIKPTVGSIQCLHHWAQLLRPQGGRPGWVGSPLAEAGQRCCPRAAQGVLQPKAHLWLPPSAGFTRYQYHQQDRPPGPLTSCESCPGPADQKCRQTGGHQGPRCWEGCPGLASGWGQGRRGGAHTEPQAPRRVCPAKHANPCPDTTPPTFWAPRAPSGHPTLLSTVGDPSKPESGFWGVCLLRAGGQFWEYSIGSSRKRIWARAQTAGRGTEPGTMGAGSPAGLHPQQPSPDPRERAWRHT